MERKKFFSARKICYVALFMALNIGLSSFGIPVPGGHLYLCDVVICFGALLFDPFSAFLIGGLGSFIGDIIFYPPAMFVTLVTHGLQAVAISLIVGKKVVRPPVWRSIIALFVGCVIMVVGYTLGSAYFYGTPEYAVIKIPYEAAQSLLGAVAAGLLFYKTPLRGLILREK